ncbi:TAXI family TRAP transporter solute-binding subunit [uncultured Pseudacidovorax sp.]|uniref:TAXI family TRAP transporter solute-binding subunit n=1 Tax=uncultured Pseudacidovorax sp. TaxID=679313 RepID=UPI0025D5665D|nr:TAXI family TRAP transporter solute-binding subunit [uncultured Pseudacidovorax sp.]
MKRLSHSLMLALLGLRDLLLSAGPLALIAVGVLVAAYIYLDPQPPRTVRLATGPQGSAYATFGEQYAAALRSNGITVQLIGTEGSLENLRLLREGRADLGFVRGGVADPVADPEAGILSLGALFYEPLWVFYRPEAVRRSEAGRRPGQVDAELPSLAGLRPLRLGTDRAGSGVPELVTRMLSANRIDTARMRISAQAPDDAAAALIAGRLDAVVLASAPESPRVQQLLRTPGIALLDLGQAEAYTRIFPFLTAVTLPRGVVDLASDVPSRDVSLVATTTSLLTREDTHPALRQLFAQAAQTLHGHAGWFNRAREFPNTRASELPVSTEGDRAINGTPPVWQRWLPFWASNLLERMWLVIGGLIVLLLPLSRVVPPLYTFRVRRRVFRWYARLRDIEARMESDPGARDALLDELDELDRVANKVTVPLSYAEELYALRHNIEQARRRLLARARS